MNLILPYPDKELYPNKSKSRSYAGQSAITRRASARYRKECAPIGRAFITKNEVSLLTRLMGTTEEHRFPLRGALLVSLRFVTASKGGRLPDVDNLVAAIKSGLDGLTDAGVWADDGLIEIAGASVSRGTVAHVEVSIDEKG